MSGGPGERAPLPARRYRLLAFDWDGTLADSTAVIASAIQAALRDLGEPVPDATAARFVIGLGLADALRNVAPGLPLHRHGELAARYRAHYLQHEENVPLFGGVSALLADLEARGHYLAVATGKSRRGLDRALVRADLVTRFHATRCADEGLAKPHPEMLLHLMDRLGVEPHETLMIGDTTHDLDLARNAGVEAVAVAYGAHGVDALHRARPRAVVHSIGELRAWLADNA